MQPPTDGEAQLVMARGHLDQLLDAITRRGFRLIGPTVRDGAIVYDEISSSADLPAGWTDEQDGGTYRLRSRGDEALFGYNVGPQSPKRYLFPPSSLLARILSEGAVIAGAGIVTGVVVGLALLRFAGGFFGNIEMPGIAPLAGAAAVLIGAAVIASLMPATRASRVDVMDALRSE